MLSHAGRGENRSVISGMVLARGQYTERYSLYAWMVWAVSSLVCGAEDGGDAACVGGKRRESEECKEGNQSAKDEEEAGERERRKEKKRRKKRQEALEEAE